MILNCTLFCRVLGAQQWIKVWSRGVAFCVWKSRSEYLGSANRQASGYVVLYLRHIQVSPVSPSMLDQHKKY